MDGVSYTAAYSAGQLAEQAGLPPQINILLSLGIGIVATKVAGKYILKNAKGAVIGEIHEQSAEKTNNTKLEANPFDADGNLKPNIKYKAGEFDYLYETDSNGRICKFEADDLQFTTRDKRLNHNPNTPGKLKDDQAGHLAGDRFGGSPNLDNLVSQSKDVNLSAYRKIMSETYVDEKSELKVYIGVNKVYISFSENKIVSIVQNDSVGFYLDKNDISFGLRIHEVARLDKSQLKKHIRLLTIYII